MNVTLAIDDELLREARKVAQAMGKSVNQLIREYLGKAVETPVRHGPDRHGA